jgi:UDP-N-acetylmuramate--alanine ligase
MYPARRVCCVFEPHQASRTARLLDEFARSLHNADKIVVTQIVPAREESQACSLTGARLAERIVELGGDAVFRATPHAILDHLQQALAPGDVLVTLGAGDIGIIAHDVAQRLRKLRKAG